MLQEQEVVRFGVYTADLRTAELKKGHEPVRVQNLPFRVLAVLLREPGRIVTREELRSELWPEDTFVDFERGISTAVSKLRDALRDSAANPRFIETVGRRGYRFIAPVARDSLSINEIPLLAVGEALAAAAPARIPNAVSVPDAPRSFLRRRAVLIGCSCISIAAVLLFAALISPRPPRMLKMTQLTHSGKGENFGGLQTDGARIYFLERHGARWSLMQTSMTGTEATPVEVPFPNTRLVAISPDHSEMLITTVAHYLGKHALWIMPIQGGTPQRVGDVTVDHAAWFPDGKRLLCSSDSEVFSIDRDGNNRHHLFNVDGGVLRFAWKPDGTSFRFAVYHPNETITLWDASATGANPHPVLPGWNPTPDECCGSWTPDGNAYVFRSVQNGQEDLWVLGEPSRWPWIPKPKPVRLTNGPTSFSEPLVSPDGKKIFALGNQARGYVARFDEHLREFVPFPLPNRAFDLTFSADGKWVAYVEAPSLTLWRSRVDGTQPLQLTASPISALQPRWSHDGKQILFTGRFPGRYFTAYMVSADGGAPQPVLQDDPYYRTIEDWSPDGQSVMIGMGPGKYPEAGVTVVNLQTQEVSEMKDSKGMRLPRWSPSGEYLAATSDDLSAVFLFDSHSQKWKQVAQAGQLYRHEWEKDGSYFYYQDSRDPGQAVFRVEPKTGKVEKFIDFTTLLRDGAMRVAFEGRAPDGSIVVSVGSSWSDLYSFDVDLP